MRKIIFFIVYFVMFTSVVFAADIQFRNSVVKVFVNANPPDYFKPWQTQGNGQTTGSAAIIDGNQIITNAHVVSHATFIQVKKANNPKKYFATVKWIGHDCDLAILEVEDATFFEGTEPIPFGDLPKLQDTVTVIGFPRGGDQVSVTEGVVSRIEVTPYAHSGRALLTVQIDAAINPGNSGGPVIQDGKLTGVAFQGLKESDNIGYIIPMPVVKHFLKDIEDDVYNGFPVMGIVSNKTENQAMKDSYKIDDVGILVTGVVKGSPSDGYLKPGDIITEFNGVAPANDRTFEFRENERLIFTYLLNQFQIGETVPLKVLRDGEEIPISLQLFEHQNLVPALYHYERPAYYIYGGLVFTVLTQDLLRNWDSNWGTGPLVSFSYYSAGPGRMREKGREEICVLLGVLPDKLNAGYHDFRFHVVDTVNGKFIQSFKELVLLLHAAEEDFVTIDTEAKARLVIDRRDIEAVSQTILEKYRIPAAYSQDVREWIEK